MANYQNTPSTCQIAILAPLGGLSVIFHQISANQRSTAVMVAVCTNGDKVATKWRSNQVWEIISLSPWRPRMTNGDQKGDVA
jgi:hypothetical protein